MVMCARRYGGETMAVTEVQLEGVQELSAEESHAYFHSQARRLLNMSGAEFIAAYDAGKFPNPDGDGAVMQLVMLLPFAR